MVNSERDRVEGLEAHRIRNCLTDICRRMYRQALLQTVAFTFFCGLVLLAILFLLNRVILLPMQMLNISWIIVSVAVIVGICLSLKHRKDLPFVARVVDERMQLSERLSTALGVIQTDPQSEFAQLQIQDAAETVKTLDSKEINPYRLPKFLKLVPIPLLLIGISFTISPFYGVPQPLTDLQQQALDQAVQTLEGRQIKNSNLQTQLDDMVKGLKASPDFDTAQKHLSNLKREVRKQQAEQTAITEATETSQSFRGMDADQLAEELRNIAEQVQIPPELQSELMSLFERLAENLPDGALSDSLHEVQGRAVTPETLQDIIAALEKMEKSTNLAQLEAQLTASQKELALATIDIESPSGGVANSDGAPGQNAGTGEVQGTREGTSDSNPQLNSQTVETGKTDSETGDGDSTPALIGEGTSDLQVGGNQLTLTAELSGTAEGFSRVFTGEVNGDVPPYLPFTDVVLNASRAYADAVKNNRIPVRYQMQIKSYLEAISTKNEKEHN